MNESRVVGYGSASRALKWSLATVLAWIAFAAVQFAATVVASHANAREWPTIVEWLGSLALLWSCLTPVIMRWDRSLRARGITGVSLVLWHAPLTLLCAVADAAMRRAGVRWFAGVESPVPFVATALYYADVVVLSYIAVLVASAALRARGRIIRQQRVKRELEEQLTAARRHALLAQLHPHFLFNTLAIVTELAHESPEAASKVLRHLCTMLDDSLGAGQDEIPLREELASIEPYLAIQRLRFVDWLIVTKRVSAEAESCYVPRLLLQPLIENAVRHGLSSANVPGGVDIEASVVDERLIVLVRNSCRGTAHAGTAGHGIGLTNLKSRLESIYGAAATFRLAADGPDHTVAEVSIPALLHPAIAQTPALALDSVDSHTADNSAAAAATGPVRFTSIALASSLGAVFWMQQSIAYLALRHRLTTESALSGLRYDGAAALGWALLAPIVLWLSRRVPLGGGSSAAGRVLLYVVACGTAVAAHGVLQWLLTGATGTFPSAEYEPLLVLDVMVFWVVVGVAKRRELDRWFTEDLLHSLSLTEKLAVARNKSEELHAASRRLAGSLQKMADDVMVDADRFDATVSALADMLRVDLQEVGRT